MCPERHSRHALNRACSRSNWNPDGSFILKTEKIRTLNRTERPAALRDALNCPSDRGDAPYLLWHKQRVQSRWARLQASNPWATFSFSTWSSTLTSPLCFSARGFKTQNTPGKKKTKLKKNHSLPQVPTKSASTTAPCVKSMEMHSQNPGPFGSAPLWVQLSHWWWKES